MSLDTALKVLNTQPQAITQKEVAAATVESETKTINDVKLAPETVTSGVDENTTEALISKTEEKAPKEESASAKFSALAKKEKAIVKRDQESKAKESTLSEREAKVAEREAKIKQSEELWDTDVFKALELRGYDYNKLTQLQLDGLSAKPAETDPVKLAKKTIDEFKAEQAAAKAKEQEDTKAAKEADAKKQQDELDAAWATFTESVNKHVEENKDDYELINLYGQQQLILDTVNEFYEKNKRVLSIKESADLVENYLLEEAKKAMSSKKLGGAKTETKAPAKEEAKPTKTLNNSMQPTAASVLPAQSEADRMKRAMAALDSRK